MSAIRIVLYEMSVDEVSDYHYLPMGNRVHRIHWYN